MDNRIDTPDSKNRVNETKDKKGLGNKVGDAMEKVGHKISEAGMPGLGQKIHDTGDKLEKDHTNPNHPQDV